MFTPDNDYKFLRDTCRTVFNLILREEFRDLGDDWQPDVRKPRDALRYACTIQTDDSAILIILRILFFYLVLRKAQDLHPAIYGIPCTSFHDSVSFYPQIRLFFREDAADTDENFSPVTSEISFRLMNETPQSMSEAKAKILGQKIKTLFGTGKGFVWKRGKVKVCYLDKKLGYDFRLLVWDKAEGKKVIEQVLDVQNHTPDWDNLSVVDRDKTYPALPPLQLVFGKQRRKPRERAVAYVRFRWAELKLHGLSNDIILCDETGYWRNALVDAE